jgi:hypothetical protein
VFVCVNADEWHHPITSCRITTTLISVATMFQSHLHAAKMPMPIMADLLTGENLSCALHALYLTHHVLLSYHKSSWSCSSCRCLRFLFSAKQQLALHAVATGRKWRCCMHLLSLFISTIMHSSTGAFYTCTPCSIHACMHCSIHACMHVVAVGKYPAESKQVVQMYTHTHHHDVSIASCLCHIYSFPSKVNILYWYLSSK